MRRSLPLFAVLALAGCAFGDGDLATVDPQAAPARPTWTEHIEPLMHLRCTACHAPDAQPGEQEGYGFDTCAKTRRAWRALWGSVWERGDMPPGGAPRMTSAELLTLERWNAQGMSCD